ncbi:hypothetical protein [Herbidospora sp. RD11066]
MRAIGYTVAWCGATALAIGVAWFGVSGVLRTALGDGEPLTPLVVAAPQPNAVSAARREPPTAEPPVSISDKPTPTASTRPSTSPTPRPRKKPAPTGRPTVARTTAPPADDPTPPPAPKQTQAPKPPPTSEAPQAQSNEKLHTFTLNGGRATVAVGEKDCRIVSATPAEGWELKTWTEPFWLRITFLKDGRESSAFCTWNALPPRLDTYET